MAQSDFDRIARIFSLIGVTAPSNESKLQPHTLLKETLKASSPALLGNSIAEISQWLSISKKLTDSPTESSRILESLEKYLKTRSFLVGSSFTVADAAVLEPLLSLSLASFPEVNRWSTLIRSLCHCHSTPQTVVLPTIFPTLIRVSSQDTKVAVASAVPKTDKAAPKTDKSEATKEPKVDQKKKESSNSKSKEKKTQSETKPENPSSGTADADLDPSKLDFRVGIIQKCWEHPEAEKLLCEEINLGESTGPRQIASGLRAHYSAAEVEGRKVIVLANLKDRNMVGFKSQGMVICASNADHSVVKLLEPPVSANVGDRVTFDGFSGEPASASALAKKKILEKLLPEMKTNDAGVPMCLSLPFKIGNELCTSPLPNANVG